VAKAKINGGNEKYRQKAGQRWRVNGVKCENVSGGSENNGIGGGENIENGISKNIVAWRRAAASIGGGVISIRKAKMKAGGKHIRKAKRHRKAASAAWKMVAAPQK